MKKVIALTIDVEPDCPPYLKTYRGIESGLPRLLHMIEKHDIEATFFITGDVALKYQEVVKEISGCHEIGCHGYSHTRFDRMTYREAEYEIEKSTEVLRRLARRDIASFRAPNLVFPESFLGILNDYGYLIDSSLAKYKIWHPARIGVRNNLNDGLLRIPVSATSSILRLPFGSEIIRRLRSPIVLFFHPWEFVDMRYEPVRWDCKINTGIRALEVLESLIKILKKKHYRFCKISDLLWM